MFENFIFFCVIFIKSVNSGDQISKKTSLVHEARLDLVVDIQAYGLPFEGFFQGWPSFRKDVVVVNDGEDSLLIILVRSKVLINPGLVIFLFLFLNNVQVSLQPINISHDSVAGSVL